ncbi:MAG: hypothetical protein ACKORE_06930 [Bacteroidota bacterium]
MSTSPPNFPDPGQYWPEAEAMLDGHFRRKRRRRFLIWFFLLIGLISSWMVIQERAANTSEALQSITTVERAQKRSPSDAEAIALETGSTDKTTQAQPDQTSPNSSAPTLTTNKTEQGIDRTTNTAPKPTTRRRPSFSSTSIQQHTARTEASEPMRNAEPVQERVVIQQSETAEDAYYGDSENNPATMRDECEDATTRVEPMDTAAVFSLEAVGIVQTAASPDSTLVLTIPAKQRSSGLLVRAGMLQTRADFHGEFDPGYIDRRRLEETPCIPPNLSVQWFNTRGNWEVRVGAGISQWGEQSSYSPYTRQQYTKTSSVYQPYNYTLVDTDSAYVYGILFYQTANVIVNDSVLVTSTDTLYGLLPDTTLAGSLPCVKHTLIQIPIELAWTRHIGKFGIGLSAGLTIGWIVRSSGSYLRADQTGLADWNNKGSSGIFMQAGAAIELSYRIRERMSLLLLPVGNTALSSVSEPLGLKKRYSAWGLQAGVRFVLD